MSKCPECGAESGIGFERSHKKAHKQWQKQVDAMPVEDVPELPEWAKSPLLSIPIVVDNSLPDGTIRAVDSQGNTAIEWKDITISDGVAYGTAYYRTHPESLEAIRKLVREAVHEELKEVM